VETKDRYIGASVKAGGIAVFDTTSIPKR